MDSDIQPTGGRPSPQLWPVYLLSSVIVVLNGTAWLGWRLSALLPFVLGALALAVLILSFRASRQNPFVFVGTAAALLCAWLVVSDAAGSLFPTKYVSAHPDAWSYGAVADYVTDYPRSQTENMPLADQFSVHLRDTRISSSCLLALCQKVFGSNNVFAAHTIFAITLLFVAYCSMAGLAEALCFGRLESQFAAMVFALFGWAANALVVGNYDNLCFVALLPGAIALLLGREPGLNRTTFALGLVTAAALYTYPEGALLSGLAVLPILIARYAGARKRGSFLLGLVVPVLLALLLWLPNAPYFIGFITHQINATMIGGLRAGSGSFPGLLTGRFLSAMFALGTEYPNAKAGWLSLVLGPVLLGLLLLGTWQLAKRHRWVPYSVVIMGLLLLWQTCFSQYDYAAYKVLFCHCWLITLSLVSGGRTLNLRLPRPATVAVLVALAASVMVDRWHHRNERVWSQTSSTSELLDLRAIKPLTGDSTVFLELHNDFDQSWALSILRRLPLIVLERRGYLAMAHVQSSLDRAKFEPKGADAFLLTDRPVKNALWHNDRFSLVRSDGAVFTKVENPNGVEQVDGQPFVWIGHSQETVLHIYAARGGKFILGGRAWWMGLSLPETSVRTLILRDRTGERRIPVEAGPPHLAVKLQPGDNIVSLCVVEKPSHAVQPDGDKRELMLGLLGYFLKPEIE